MTVPTRSAKKRRRHDLIVERKMALRFILTSFVMWLVCILAAYSVIDSINHSAEETDFLPNHPSIRRTVVDHDQQQQQQEAWDGWQPEIAGRMECSWSECFKTHHSCATCRDSPMTQHPPAVPPDWLPDVTMLHRMMLKGVDQKGSVWPPVLPQELCHDMEDSNKQALEAIPIVAATTATTTSINQEAATKVMCLIYTEESAHATRLRAARETWAGGCDGFLAFSTLTDPRIPAISIYGDDDDDENTSDMCQNVRSIWKYVDQHFVDDFDFFFLAGDDIFVLPQNLRNFLQTLRGEHHYVGRRFLWQDNYFNSADAGYALSRSTVKKLVAAMDRNEEKCSIQDFQMPDLMIAQCLSQALEIHVQDTRDEKGRERFHPFSPSQHFHYKPSGQEDQPDWYVDYNKEWGLKLGKDCCAPDSVSFHNIRNPAMARHLHQLLYHCDNNK